MCGIAGKLKWGARPDENSVRAMCDAMSHRGPDDEGIVCFDDIALGHRRLSVIDLSKKASQPMLSADGRFCITYNGEVYNFRELRRELEKEGFEFKTSSDTEVVLYAYIHWGVDSLNKFNGMFAFAIWDNLERELFLARDRFGQKPLYYHMYGNGGIVFASEIEALMLDDDIPLKLDYEGLNCYLALGYILAPMTCYRGVLKLERATFMRVSDLGSRVEVRRYWDYAEAFRIELGTSDRREISEELLKRLESSVERRMVSDVPVGAFLSGGVDSSSIVALMKRFHNGDLHTFSMGFDIDSYSELADADRVADWAGTVHHSRVCGAGKEDSERLFVSAVDSYGEPFSDNSLIPTYEVSSIAAKDVKVVLSGDGADELFAGYATYKADVFYRTARMIPDFCKRILAQDRGGYNPRKKLGLKYKLKQFFYGTLYSAEEAHYLWRLYFRPEERVGILGNEYRDLVYDSDPFRVFRKHYDDVKDLDTLSQNLYVDALTWLTDDILVKLDRASMRHSLEARCPYLDPDLVNFAASIPSSLKLNFLNSKYILKKSLTSILPPFVLNKSKSGFNAPVTSWLETDGTIDEFRLFNRHIFDRFITHN